MNLGLDMCHLIVDMSLAAMCEASSGDIRAVSLDARRLNGNVKTSRASSSTIRDFPDPEPWIIEAIFA